MKQIIITQNDYGITLQLTLEDNSNKPIDLTGSYITVDIVKPDMSKTTKNVSITDVINGEVSYILESEDTAQVGNYSLYFAINSNDCKITSQQIVNYYVIEKNGGANNG